MGNLKFNSFYFFTYFFIIFKYISSLLFFYYFKNNNKKKKDTSNKIQRLQTFYYKLFKLKILIIFKFNFFFDFFFLIFFNNIFFNKIKLKIVNKFNSKIKEIDINSYKEENYFEKNMGLKYSLFSGLKYFWILLRYWILGILLSCFFFYYLTYIRYLSFNKIVFEWFLIVFFLYLLLTSFVYFFKKYQFNKYTSVIQRFWKRSFILFWIIEGYLFFVFFYLTLNASEEPVYMYDQLKIYKTHLFSWRLFLIKILPIIFIIFASYYLLLSLKWSIFNKQIYLVIIITIFLLFIFWLEFYQFYHIINFFGNLVWIFNFDEFLWNLELEFRRTRLSNNYLSLCLMAKFWHLIFIVIFWIFFVLRINELNRIRYPLLAANYQNFILLYLLTWLYMYPWFKFFFRNLLDNPYNWLMLDNRSLSIRILFNDFKSFILFFFNDFTIYIKNIKFYILSQESFFYWYESSCFIGFNQFKKHFLKDYLIFIFKE